MKTLKFMLLMLLVVPGLVAREPVNQEQWDLFKQSYSVVLFINHKPTKKYRCAKFKLADLVESPRPAVEVDEEPNWVGGAQFLPKGTELISLIPKGTGASCVIAEWDNDGCNSIVVVMPEPFIGKFFELKSDSCYSCKAAILVPNDKGVTDEV
jgi:hypothetical protein